VLYDRLSRWSGEFTDSALEAEFRAAEWPERSRAIRQTVLTGGLFYLAVAPTDYVVLGLTPAFWGCLAIRLIGFLAVLGTAQATRQPHYGAEIEASVAVTFYSLAIGLALIIALLGGNLPFHANAVLLAILLGQTFIPARFIHSAGATLTLTVLFFVIGFFVLSATPQEWLVVASLVIAANLVGASAARGSNITRRRLWLQSRSERSLRERLQAEAQSRERAEAEARERARSFSELFAASPVPLILADRNNGRLLRANRAASDYLGLDPESALTINAASMLARRQDRYKVMSRLARGQRLRGAEVMIERLDGTKRIALVSGGPVELDGHEAAIAGLTDITELDTQRARAEAASAAKSAFLAAMSHEIRTPLNAVIGMTGLLEDTPLSRQQRELVVTLRDGGKELLAILNDVLALAAEARPIGPGEPKVVTLAAFIEDLTAGPAADADRKGLRFDVELDPDLPSAVETDPGRLSRILAALLSNALKFTDRGGITLSVGRRVEVASTRLVIRVTDTGPGIKPELRDRIFDPFVQADDRRARKYAGAGLGLAVARRLAEALGGGIMVEDNPAGRGAVFAIDLPLKIAERVPGARLRGTGREILVVGTDEGQARVIGDLVTAGGRRATVAPLADLSALLSEWQFDGAVLVLEPETFEGAMARLKTARAADGGALPVVALVAAEEDGPVPGAVATLTLPVEAPGLDHALRRARDAVHAAETAAKAEPGAAIDAAQFEAIFDTLEPKLVNEIVALGRADLSAALDQFKAAIAEDRLDDALAITHSLKDVAGNLALVTLKTATGTFQQSLREKRPGDAPRLAERLITDAEAALAALNARISSAG